MNVGTYFNNRHLYSEVKSKLQSDNFFYSNIKPAITIKVKSRAHTLTNCTTRPVSRNVLKWSLRPSHKVPVEQLLRPGYTCPYHSSLCAGVHSCPNSLRLFNCRLCTAIYLRYQPVMGARGSFFYSSSC